MADADGQLILFERVPRAVVEGLIEEREGLLAQDTNANT